MAAAVSAEKGSLSFKFTKKVENKVLSSDKSKIEGGSCEDKDYVVSVDDSGVKSSQPKAEKKELVIPLIKNNVWRIPKEQKSEIKETSEETDKPNKGDVELTLEQQAIKEILADASGSRDSKGTTQDMSIPLLMQNKVPEGYETDEKVDVSLRAEEPTMDDYDNVPIEEYGLAMLRGMGWNPGKPIGARCTQIAKPIEAVMRPKGLGLGAERKMGKPPPIVAKEEGELVLKTGAYVRIEQGPNKDLYGQVEGLDDDNARVYVKLALGGKTVSVSELFIALVSKKDYQRDGKLLNKEKYDDYKRKHEPKEEEVVDRKRDKDEKHSSHKKSRVEKERDSSKSSSKRERSRSPKRKEEFWLRPQIRVRFIDRR
uniref:Putative g patch domain and kow motifs-containing protein n=1 Tax=Amblyomma americanum TaxID=6943 RepID=A0A0C9SCB0_AMBAM